MQTKHFFSNNLRLTVIFILMIYAFDALALQLEGGINTDWNKESLYIGLDVFPWSVEQTNELAPPGWMGYCLHGSYEGGDYYAALMFGKADIMENTTHTLFLGPKFGITNYKHVGFLVKGSTMFWHVLPVTLAIDPKYDFDGKGWIWDFKAAFGLGRILSFDQMLGKKNKN